MDDQKIEEAGSEAKELERLKKEREEYLAGWQRARADFVNYKKEEMSRMGEMVRYQMEDVMHDLIAVIDNFNLGLAALEKQGAVEKGIYMIKTQLEDILRRRGLTKIEVAAGTPFDPATMEAITEVESSHPPGSVVEEIEPGYRFHERILRPARVKVSK